MGLRWLQLSRLLGGEFLKDAVLDGIVMGEHEDVRGFEDEETTGFNGVIEASLDLVEGDFGTSIEAEGQLTGGGVTPFVVELEVCGVEDETCFFARFASCGCAEQFAEVLVAAG